MIFSPQCAGTTTRPEQWRPGPAGTAVAQRGRHASAAGLAQDITMVELQDTHDGSSGGGPETELRRIRRTGVYALMDERILRSRVTRL